VVFPGGGATPEPPGNNERGPPGPFLGGKKQNGGSVSPRKMGRAKGGAGRKAPGGGPGGGGGGGPAFSGGGGGGVGGGGGGGEPPQPFWFVVLSNRHKPQAGAGPFLGRGGGGDLFGAWGKTLVVCGFFCCFFHKFGGRGFLKTKVRVRPLSGNRQGPPGPTGEKKGGGGGGHFFFNFFGAPGAVLGKRAFLVFFGVPIWPGVWGPHPGGGCGGGGGGGGTPPRPGSKTGTVREFRGDDGEGVVMRRGWPPRVCVHGRGGGDVGLGRRAGAYSEVPIFFLDVFFEGGGVFLEGDKGGGGGGLFFLSGDTLRVGGADLKGGGGEKSLPGVLNGELLVWRRVPGGKKKKKKKGVVLGMGKWIRGPGVGIFWPLAPKKPLLFLGMRLPPNCGKKGGGPMRGRPFGDPQLGGKSEKQATRGYPQHSALPPF